MKPGTILRVGEDGGSNHDRLLRSARVVVAARHGRPSSAPEASAAPAAASGSS